MNARYDDGRETTGDADVGLRALSGDGLARDQQCNTGTPEIKATYRSFLENDCVL